MENPGAAAQHGSLQAAAQQVGRAVQEALLTHFGIPVDAGVSINIASDTVRFFASRAQRGASDNPRVAGPLEYKHPARTAAEIAETPAANSTGAQPRMPSTRGMTTTQRIRQHQATLQKPAQPAPNVPIPAPNRRNGSPWAR